MTIIATITLGSEMVKSKYERSKIALAIMSMKGAISYFKYIEKNKVAMGEDCVNHYKQVALDECSKLSEVCYNNPYANHPEALAAISQAAKFFMDYAN